MKKESVIIVGAMYSLNYGDGIICKTVSNIMKEKLGYNTTIFGISGQDAYPKVLKNNTNKKIIKNKIAKLFPINQYIMLRSRKKLQSKLDKINPKDYDALIFAGGQLFMDCFVDYIKEIVKWTSKNKIPVYFNCCGMGHLKFINKHKLYKSLTSENVRNISLRDGIEQFQKTFKLDSRMNIYRIYDPAIEVSEYYKPEYKKSVKLGIGIIHPINFRKNCVNIKSEEYEEIIHQVILYCKKKKIEFEFFTNGDLADQQYCINLAKKLGYEEYVSERPNSPEQLIDVITRYKRIVSCRLHSLIIAASYGIPTAAIIWDLKVSDFMNSIDRKDMCISMKSNPSCLKITNTMDLLFKQGFGCSYGKFPLASENLKKFLMKKND